MLSGALFASAHAGEKTKDVIQHFLLAFSTLGILQTDNGPAYTSKNFKQFLDWWGGGNTPLAFPTPQRGNPLWRGLTVHSGESLISSTGELKHY